MSNEPNNPLYSALAERLLAKFFVRKDTYAIQTTEGYQRLKKPISQRKIRLMLSSQESLLAYQFENNLTSWICLDFDVSKTALDANGTGNRLHLIQKILEAVKIAADYLSNKRVNYLIEFSGNRGFHIWILFSDKLTRRQGFLIIKHLLEQAGIVQKSGDLVIDLFPGTPTSSAKYGKGVKLPLSFHKKSKSYSYFIAQISNFFATDDIWRTELSRDFLTAQLEILNASTAESFAEISRKLNFTAPAPDEVEPHFLRQNVHLTDAGIDLSLAKSKLAQCSIVNELFKRASSQDRLSEKERLPIVGLLNRIRTPSRPELGRDLATQFFSSLPGYDETKTRNKLASLRLYPPTCALLKDLFPDVDCSCSGVLVRSPSDFLVPLMPEGEIVEPQSPFELSLDDAASVLIGEKRYSKINDEIAVVSTLKELEKIDVAMAHSICRLRSTNSWPPVEFYSHERIEKLEGRRTLSSLSARDKVWSSGAILALNRIYALEFSEHSYGYRIQPFFQGGDIFKPWLPQWKLFTGRLSGYIYRRESSDCWLIKIDIKSFYSSIDLDRLEVKLLHGPTKHIEEMLGAMPIGHVIKYRSICTELIRLCRIIMDGSPGIPQGPAFARYLAEVFLMEFDRQMEGLTEDGVIFYCRYVDDIFIVVDSDADPKPIERIALDALRRLSLEQNLSKHYSGPTDEFRGQFMKYRNDTKYLVDQVSRRFESSSGDEIRDAADKLRHLVEGDFGEGVQNEHLNFLYTHLEEDENTDILKRKYEVHLIGLSEGRGSLFSNFYSYFLRDPQRIATETESLTHLSGLRRQVLINTLLGIIVAGSAPIQDSTIECIRGLFSAYLDAPDLTPLDLELILCASLAEPKICPSTLFYAATDRQIVRALRFPIKKALPPLLFECIRRATIGLPMDEFVGTLSEILFHNEIDGATSSALNQLFTSRALGYIRAIRPENQSLSFLSEPRSSSECIAQKYYNVVCLVSGTRPELGQAQLEALWKSMVMSYNKIDVFDPGAPAWLRNVTEETTSLVNINAVLMSRIGDGFCPGVVDQHALFTTYHDYLAIFTLLPSSRLMDLEVGPRDEELRALRHRLKDDPNLFIRWILDDPPARFYPNRPECLENTLRNDTMMLFRDGEILVRLRSELSKHLLFSRSAHKRSTESFMSGKYMTLKIDKNATGYERIDARLKNCMTLVEFASTTIAIHTATAAFAVSCGEHFRMVNIFADDSAISATSGAPLVPYSLLGPHLVFSNAGGVTSRINNPSGAILGCLDLIRGCKLYLIPPEHPLTLNGLGLVEQLDAFDELNDKWALLSSFIECLDKIPNYTAHDVELCKTVGILNVLKKRRAQGARLAAVPLSLPEAFFQHYLKIKCSPERHLLFDASSASSKNTLHDFFWSIQSCVQRFTAGFEHSFWSFDLVDMLAQESASIVSAAYTLLGAQTSGTVVTLSDFGLVPFSTDNETRELKVGDEIIPDSMFDEVFALNVSSGEFKFILWRDYVAHFSVGGRSFYAMHAYGRWLLVVVGGALLAAYERLCVREVRWSRYCKNKELRYTHHLFFENSRRAENSVRTMPGFSAAVDVVKENHLAETAFAEHLVASWVARFDPEYRDMLVQIIGAHEVVRRSDAAQFVADLRSHYRPGSIFFLIKRFEDVSGTHRLIYMTNGGLEFVRKLNLEHIVARLVDIGNKKAEGDKLVIFADVCLSGGQICDALENHYLASTWSSERVDGAHLHSILPEEREAFLRGFLLVREIKFVFALFTDDARTRLVATLNKFGVPEDRIQFHGREIEFSRIRVTNNAALPVRVQSQFLDLLKNTEILNSLFINAGDPKKHLEQTNLVARQLSVPKLGAKLFTLEPRDRGLPLFKRIREH